MAHILHTNINSHTSLGVKRKYFFGILFPKFFNLLLIHFAGKVYKNLKNLIISLIMIPLLLVFFLAINFLYKRHLLSFIESL